MFVDPNSKITQDGKLKLEGVYKAGFFKSVKNYIVIPFENSEYEQEIKSRGMPSVVKNLLTPHHFRTDNFYSENLFFQYYKLHPTIGGEQMLISLQKRRMTNSLNCKRKIVFETDSNKPKRVSTIFVFF